MREKFASTGIDDPISCGEDFGYNSRRAVELAAIHCQSCADYHIHYAANRQTGRKRSTDADRPQLASLIRDLLTKRAGVDADTIEIVIAGAGDTGILATTAHAAYTAGESILARSRFTVIDLCRTPLGLCEEYGKRHGLPVRGEVVDITAGEGSTKADLIVVHGLLRFIQRRYHGETMRRLGSQLKPGGCLVLSNRLQPPPLADGYVPFSDSSDVLLNMVESGAIECPEPLEQFVARVRRYKLNRRIRPENEIASLDTAKSLFQEARLPVLSANVFDEAAQVTGGKTVLRPRLHAVLGAPRGA